MILKAVLAIAFVFISVLLINRHISKKQKLFELKTKIAEDPDQLRAQLEEQKRKRAG